ncbi:Uncharacterised protein [Acinetobacter baumannii]|nr:Uncharacterised protein [Acinetobacter baumannii]
MEGFPATDRAAQRADAAGVDADAGALRNVFHNGAGGGVDGVQAVAALDQHAGAELAGWGAHAGHDRRRQRNLEGGNRVVETFDVVQTSFTRVVGEQARGHQHVQELGAFVDLAADAVLHQILAFQLLDGGIREVHVAPVIDKGVHLLELFSAVVFQQMFIVFAHLDHARHVSVQLRRFELAVSLFTQVEDRQASGQVLIVRRIAGDQIGSGFDDGFVNVGGFDAVIKLNVGTQLYLRNRDVVQSFCGPIDDPVDFVEVDALFTAIAFSYKQTLVHVVFYLSVWCP